MIASGLLLVFAVPAMAGAERGYADTRAGQMHFYRVTPDCGATARTPVVLFHPSPRSGLIYRHLMEDLGKDRVVIAFDSPGFGNSDGLAEAPSMNEIALIMADALADMGYGESELDQVDVFGFHTGSLIAVELALERPELVRRVMLSGLPWREEESRQMLLDRIDPEVAIDQRKIEYAWLTNVELREEGVSFDEATRSFAENIKALTGDYWHAYHAVWTYPIAERLPQLGPNVLIINYPFDTETEPTRLAHEQLLPGADYVELTDLEDIYFPFSAHSRLWSDAMTNWLDSPLP